MPRAKQPTLGSYPNRSDLRAADSGKTLAVQGAPGGEYGDEARQESEQRAIPEGSTPIPTASATPASAAAHAPVPQVGSGAPTVPNAGAAPGSLPFLHPTNRPDEPVTAGLPFGAGPGPEALQRPAPPLVSDTLSTLASSTKSGNLQALADAARSLGI